MSRPARRVALYGFLASGNLGNDASLETVLAWFARSHPEVELCGVTITPEQLTARYGIPASPLAWAAPGWLPALPGRALGRLVDAGRSLALAGRVDAVVVPGMGVLEETIGVRPWGLPLWLFLAALACRARGRSFVLLDVGADPCISRASRWLQVATVRLASHVSVRDRRSAEALVANGAPAPAEVAPDLAFAHPAPVEADPEPGRLVVGVMAYYGVQDDPVAGAPVRARYVDVLAHALARLLDDGARVVLVVGDRVDADVAHEVERTVRGLRPGTPADAVAVRPVTTFAALTSEMARAEVVVASRFHNVVAALRLARPTVSVGYAVKSDDLMRAAGLADAVQDIDRLDADVLVAQVRTARRHAASISAAVAETTRPWSDQVGALLDRLARENLRLAPAAGPPTAPARHDRTVAPTPYP